PQMRDWLICDVALVDLDGDGKLDLYFSAWMHGSHILFNRGGEFSGRAHTELPRATEACAASTAFADVDRDGLIDIVTGGATFELNVGHTARGRMGALQKRLAPPVASCGISTDTADISRCDALARFQAAVARGRDNWTIELCRELPDPADQRDCAVTAHYWTRILLRLPASGADKAAVLAECAKIPKDFTTMHDVCEAMAQSPMDYNQSHKTFTDEIPSVAHAN